MFRNVFPICIDIFSHTYMITATITSWQWGLAWLPNMHICNGWSYLWHYFKSEFIQKKIVCFSWWINSWRKVPLEQNDSAPLRRPNFIRVFGRCGHMWTETLLYIMRLTISAIDNFQVPARSVELGLPRRPTVQLQNDTTMQFRSSWPLGRSTKWNLTLYNIWPLPKWSISPNLLFTSGKM